MNIINCHHKVGNDTFHFYINYLCFWKQWYDQTSQPQDMTLPRVRYDRKNPLIRIIFIFELNSINRVILYEYTLKQKKIEAVCRYRVFKK